MNLPAPLILASQSPRRKQLLEWADIPFTVKGSSSEEHYPLDLELSKVAEYLAKEKAEEIAKGEEDKIVLAADTVVVCAGEHLGKAVDRDEAISMLQKLSGSKHEVITGVCICYQGNTTCFSETTRVEFHELSLVQIEYYVDKYKPYDKAGAYGIQEWIGVTGIKSITGDFYNVMGLPVSRVVQALQEL